MTYFRFLLLKSRSRKTLGDLRVTNESYSNLLQLTHNLLKGTIDMEVFLIMPTTPEGKAKLSKELTKFHAEPSTKDSAEVALFHGTKVGAYRCSS